MTSRWRANNEKYCSIKCASIANKEARSKTQFKVGSKPWHKGKTGVYKPEVLRAMRNAKLGTVPGNWKGDAVSYITLHKWVAYHKGRPNECEHCGTTEDRQYHWANLSGEYMRDLNDWVRLCVPCHSKLDSGRNSIKERYENV